MWGCDRCGPFHLKDRGGWIRGTNWRGPSDIAGVKLSGGVKAKKDAIARSQEPWTRGGQRQKTLGVKREPPTGWGKKKTRALQKKIRNKNEVHFDFQDKQGGKKF